VTSAKDEGEEQEGSWRRARGEGPLANVEHDGWDDEPWNPRILELSFGNRVRMILKIKGTNRKRIL
jgi:hypothetical protein